MCIAAAGPVSGRSDFFAMITNQDDKKRRCPRLGHEVRFAYCREPGEPTPCRRICDCWWETFDVVDFIKEHYGDDVLNGLRKPPGSKAQSIFDILHSVRQNIDRNDAPDGSSPDKD